MYVRVLQIFIIFSFFCFNFRKIKLNFTMIHSQKKYCLKIKKKTFIPLVRRNIAANIGGCGECGTCANGVSSGINRSPPPSIENPLILTYRTAAQ